MPGEMNNKGYYQSYFMKKHNFFDYRRGWLKGDCPKCHREEKCGVNVERDHLHCFVCGYNRPLATAVMEIERLETRAELNTLLKTYRYSRIKKAKSKPLAPANVVLPDGFILPRVAQNNLLARQVMKYLMEERGLDYDRINRAKVGLVTDHRSDFYGYMIFPFYEKRVKLIYYQARTFLGMFPKFKNPDEEILGIGKSQVIYNIDALWTYPEVNIVESIINVLTLDMNSVGVLGKSISPWQLNALIKSPVKVFNIMLDPDGWDKAIQMAENLTRAGKQVRVIRFPLDEDVNSIGKMETLGLLKSQDYIYNNIMELQKLKYGSVNH